MKRKKSGWWIFGLCSFFLFLNQPSHAGHTLRVGTLQLNGHDKLIILGIAARPHTFSADLNFSNLGFEGNGMDHVDPKFLLEVTSEGVTRVRSFDLKTLNDDELVDSFETSGLPPLLLNVNHAKRDKKLHAVGNFFAGLGKSLGFPIALGTSLGTLPRRDSENTRKLQASYLMELINKALPPFDGFPELKYAFSNNSAEANQILRSLGEALLTRYNPKSNWAGLQVPSDKNGSFYEEWRQVQAGYRSKNQGNLVRATNEAGLDLVSMGEDFAFVLVNANPKSDKTPISKEDYLAQFKGLGLDQHGPQEIIDAVVLDPGKGTLIPWYLVSFMNPGGATDLVNFIFPGRVGERTHELAKAELEWELNGSILPLTNWLVKIGRSAAKSGALKKGNTEYLKRIESYGAVLSLAETHYYDAPKSEGIAFEPFRKALGALSKAVNFDSQEPSEILNDMAALTAAAEQRLGSLLESPDLQTKKATKAGYFRRLWNFIEEVRPKNRKIGSVQESRVSRSPCGNASSHSVTSSVRKPVILFLVDGLRPDRFRQAAEEGLFPNLKALFLQKGTELESFTSRALTLPSWSTIFTGFEPDVHGIRSNTPFSRTMHKMTDNYLDPRKDVFSFKNHKKNRAFQRLEENKVGEEGKVWLPGYFQKEQVHANFLPVVNGPSYPIKSLLNDFFTKYPYYANDIRFLATALDTASAQETARAIRNDKNGKLRLIMNWYASVDEASHHNNRLLPTVYSQLDQAIGAVLEAAKEHPYLKDATIFLISDHGHSGGYGPFNETSNIFRPETPSKGVVSGPLLSNTDINLTKFFAGQYHGYQNYGFEVGAMEADNPRFDLGLLEDLQLASFKYTKPKHRLQTRALVDYAGDNMAQIYIVKESEPSHRQGFYELSRFNERKGTDMLNIPFDLLNVQVPNLRLTDPSLLNQISQLSHLNPVRLLAMPLPGNEARLSADAIGANPETANSSRDPVLVMSKKQGSDDFLTGLILTRDLPFGINEFRYVVLKNFLQASDGRILGEVSDRPEDDPLGYVGQIISGRDSFSNWYSDREWLKMAHHHAMPTAIFALPRATTLSPRYTDPSHPLLDTDVRSRRKAEVPDFVLIANPGYAFRSEAPCESDHGGLLREEVRNTFFVSSLSAARYRKHIDLDEVFLNRDVMPTVLNYAGLGELKNDPLPMTQGDSFKDLIESAQ